jgi:branched-chain amino acid transport system substrate-binding protein
MTRNVVPELQNGVDLMENMKKVHGFNTAFVIIQDCLFARNAMDFFSKLAVQKGWNILGTEKIPMGTTDYSPALIKCKNSGAKVLLYWWADTTGSILYRQFKDLEVPAVPVGFSPASQEHEIYEAVGKKSDYFIFSMGKACVSSTKIPGATKFQKDFTTKFGKRPFGGCGGGYNGPYVLKDAIERAGSLKTDAIIGALEKTDYMSINGKVRFDNNHEVIYSDDPKEGWVGNWSQWIKGERVCVWPTLVADAQVVLPPWMKK